VRALLSCLALVLAACGDSPRPVTPAPVPAAPAPVDAGHPATLRLTKFSGAVTVERGGRAVPTAVLALEPGDAVETGDPGAATLEWAHGRVLELGPEGRVEVGRDGEVMTLSVPRGLVLSRVPAGAPVTGGVELTISTPFGLTRLSDAALSLSVDDVGATLEVETGLIEWVTKDGQVQKVPPGKARLGKVRDLPPVPVTIVVGDGRGEYQAPGAARFQAFSAKKPPTMLEGGVLRVVDGHLGLSAGEGAPRVTVLRGAQVKLGASGAGDTRSRLGLELAQGELDVAAVDGRTARLEVGGGVAITAGNAAQFHVKKTRDGYELGSLAGDLEVERPGAPALKLPGGQTLTLGPDAPRFTPAVLEPVQLPTREHLALQHTALRRVSLTWDDAHDEPTYRVTLGATADLAQPLLDGEVHQRFVSLFVPLRGQWYWRVLAGEREVGRGELRIGPEPLSSELSRLRNVVPDGAQTTTIYFQDKPPAVTFAWKEEAGAARWALKVYDDGQLQKPKLERPASGTEVALPENTLTEGHYLWSVTPLDAKGAELRGAHLNKLQMVYDNAVTALVVKAPRNGEPSGKVVRATGIAPVGSRVTVNDKLMVLDSAARFDGPVSPLPGGWLVFHLTRRGDEVFLVRSVRSR
jgi:hypothetical protein